MIGDRSFSLLTFLLPCQPPILLLLSSFLSLFHSQFSLRLENLALRHQLNVLRRHQRGRVRLRRADRLFWVWLSKAWTGWKSALVIVKPETVIGWHRKGFRLYWRGKSRIRRPGRPTVSQDVGDLIRKMSIANPIWGAPRIHGELWKLGIEVLPQLTVGGLSIIHLHCRS